MRANRVGTVAFVCSIMTEDSGSFKYLAYGVSIESEVELRELQPGPSGAADARIRLGEVGEPLVARHIQASEVFERPGARVRVSDNAMNIVWDRVGKFLIHSGREVLIEPEAGCREDDLQPFVTGPVLSALLHQRGYCVLHASAVLLEGQVAVFLGAKGYGKSTIAAQLHERGHKLVSDDIVPVSVEEDRILTYPGFPRIKLSEEAIVALGRDPEEFPKVHRYVEKRSFNNLETLPPGPLRLRGIFLLAEGDSVSIEPLSQAAAFMELATHSFLNRYLAAMNCLEKHFQQSQALVRSVPMFRLSRPFGFAKTADISRRIEELILEMDIGQNGSR
ncbi:MAG: hypothetical protein DWQ47_03545 [Acidobacteria bacterium]|nr:MAG: hypothetical protein DWQ32_07095 [Acidobacteriota bacterium]REK01475.1 MAG: hypothetical protein DWQ38_03530 [Acidobacteriota bacterium]REK14431.1 MAG: hypothetical protein DWQ43_12785 [Acidobacteriota bacterium]REK45146.1 MAG: hypothetical protein DWQ47_03545 [Acidobacteriota bacterium]